MFYVLRVHKHKIGVPFPVPSVLASARMRRRFSRCKVCSAVYGDVLAAIVSADTFFLFSIVSAVLEQRVQEYRFSSRYRLDNRTVRSDMRAVKQKHRILHIILPRGELDNDFLTGMLSHVVPYRTVRPSLTHARLAVRRLYDKIRFFLLLRRSLFTALNQSTASCSLAES